MDPPSTPPAHKPNRWLWRTRGKHWDYGFVIVPGYPSLADWYGFFSLVFRRAPTAREPTLTGGWIRWQNSDIPFIGTSVVDPRRVDDSHRPIVHHFAWFDPPGVEHERCAVGDRWGLAVLEVLDPLWQRLYEQGEDHDEAAGQSVANCLREVALDGDKQQRVMLELRLTVTDKGMVVACSREFSALSPSDEEPEMNRVGATSVSALERQPSTTSALVQERIAEAIAEGEAYALGVTPWSVSLGRFWKLTRREHQRATSYAGDADQAAATDPHDADVSQKVALSFAGDPEDLFVRLRIRDIYRRVAAMPVYRKPRRGFDALVEALRPALAHTQGDLTQPVARLIGASADDDVVRNLVLRLKTLRK